MGVQELKSKPEFDEALKDNKFVVLDCFATWCGPCRIIAPKVEQFSGTYKNAAFFKLDVDKVEDVAGELGVRAMPTFMIFKDGEKVAEVVGANPVALNAAIEANVLKEGVAQVVGVNPQALNAVIKDKVLKKEGA